MTVKDFKRRYLLSRCSPPLFYLPGNKDTSFELSLKAEGFYNNPLTITHITIQFFYYSDWTIEVDELGNPKKWYNPFDKQVYNNWSEFYSAYSAAQSQHGGVPPVICINDEIDHIVKNQTQFPFPIDWGKIVFIPQTFLEKTPKLFVGEEEIPPRDISASQVGFSLSSKDEKIILKNLQKGMVRLDVQYEKEDIPTDDERYIYSNQRAFIKDPNKEQKEIDYADYYGEGPYSMTYHYTRDSSSLYLHFNNKGKLSLINNPQIYYKYTKEIINEYGHYWTDSRKDGFEFYHLKYLFPNNQIIYGWDYIKALYTTSISYQIWYKEDGEYIQGKSTPYRYSSQRFTGANIPYLNKIYPEDSITYISGRFTVGEWVYKDTPYARYTNYFGSTLDYRYEYDHADLEEIQITKDGTNIDNLPNKKLNIYFKAIHHFTTKSAIKSIIPPNSVNFYTIYDGTKIYCSKVAVTECYIDGEYCGYYCLGSLVGSKKEYHNIGFSGQGYYPYVYEYNHYLDGTYEHTVHYIMPGETGEEQGTHGTASNFYQGSITYDLNKDNLFGVQFSLVDGEGKQHDAPLITPPRGYFTGRGDGYLFMSNSKGEYQYGEWVQGIYIMSTGYGRYLNVTFFDRNCYNDTMGINYDNHNCQSYYYLGDGLTKDQLRFFMSRMVN